MVKREKRLVIKEEMLESVKILVIIVEMLECEDSGDERRDVGE